MPSLKSRLYHRALGRPASAAREIAVPARDLFAYLWKRGAAAWLRGLVWRLRFRQCGRRLLVGRSVRIFFPRQISVGRNVLLGDYLYLNGFARDGITLGDGVRIREHGWVQATSTLDDPGRGLSIGDDTYIGPRCYLGAGGGITIGRQVMLGGGVHLLAEDHEFHDPDRPIQEQGVTRRGILVEDGAWIGNGAIVVDGVTIGRGAVVGAGSVVIRDVPPQVVVMGNPARVVGRRSGWEAPASAASG